ncbi:hypothetical protein Tco_1056485 [Tanacetum coccineum]|uniref:Uncharacterized protein n=1 Tax=Tanacetum coccineum TaxID=301880 RepID=A0ABQ5H2N1_9ASTR
MTVDIVTFQTNNVMGNFNYPPNVPGYKLIMKFLLNCPLKKAFTNCPSVVYQNFLREFWSTAVAYDLFPSTDETEQRPLREFLIKFSFLNGKRPLTLEFNTFCSSTGLEFNNFKYVAHPTPEAVKKELGKIAINPSYLDKTPVLKNSFPVAWRILFTFVIQVLGGNYSSTEHDEKFGFLPGILSNSNFTKDPSKVTDIELTTHMIAVNNQKDSVSLLPLVAKPKKGKSHIVTPTLPKSQGPEVLGALSKKSKRPNTGLSSTLDEGTRKSKPLPESTATPPKDSGGNIQPLDKDITSTTSNEGTAKTTSHPEGSLGDKDSGGNMQPADMELIHPTVVDLSGTGAKYQVDQTQSTRLRNQSLPENEGKPSHEGELDT